MVPDHPSRRTALALLAGTAATGCLGTSRPAAQPDEETPQATTPGVPDGARAGEGSWPMLGGDAEHSGYAPSVSGRAPGAPLRVDAEGPMTSPTVVDGTAYLVRGVPTDDGPHATVEAYALDSGERTVRVPLAVDGDPVGFRFSAPNSNLRPVYYRGLLYVVVGHRVAVVDPAAGRRAWTTDAVEDLSFNEPPTVTDAGVFAGGPFGFAAYDHDGALRWRLPPASADDDDPTSRRFGSPRVAAVRDGRAYLSWGAQLRAVDVADGSTVWSHDPDGPTASTVVAGSDVLVRTSLDGVEAVTTEGDRAWRADWPGGAVVRPAVADGVAYVAGLTGHVVAYDLADGEHLWSRTVDPGGFAQGTTATVSETAVHLLRVDPGERTVRVLALDRADGEVDWELTRTATRARGVVPASGRYVFTAETTPEAQRQSSTAGAGQDTSATLWAFPADGGDD
ncbi:PQQ-binding-like beta-propeller repeat protein [Halobaculum lipolyticum]|uniref:PQQ-binding-like beta-propeller repeat protein n=1 Tax=Halobaculum lipolyticum TaxID=3032001 RepID=A0ABD5WAR8_9EURY|nr:PQQ-binding-like beta-propeller repeat protein [Halobaculum sp. DT31]